MRKALVMFAIAVVIMGGLQIRSSAVTADVAECKHEKRVTAAVSLPWDYSYVHPVHVGNKPNNEPIFVNCTVTGQRQKFRTFCADCQYIFNEYEDEISENHSIKH